MPHKSVVSKLGLALLALVTVVATVYAFIEGRSAPPSTIAQPSTPTVTGATTPGRAPTTPGTQNSASPSASPQTAMDIRRMLAGTNAVTVLVISDESGGGTDGWVRQWADRVAERRQVNYQTWSNDRFAQPIKLGASNPGGVVTIRNSSYTGANAAELAGFANSLRGMQPQIVIMSLGVNEQPDSVKADMTKLYDAVAFDAAGIVVLQNFHRTDPTRQSQTIAAMKAWSNEESLPVIDIQGVFEHDSAPLADLLDQDGKIPNQRGANLWAFGVSLVIGP